MRSKKHTRIVVGGEAWLVPRGFGRAYLRAARDELDHIARRKPGVVIDFVIDMLALVGYEATREQVAGWPLRKRVEAGVYAATVHARAGDNPVQVHPRPEWLPERPWQGPTTGSGAFEGPSGTPIPEPPRCDWHSDHDRATDRPTGQRCEALATHRIVWLDGSRRYSHACGAHLKLHRAAPRRKIEKLGKGRKR